MTNMRVRLCKWLIAGGFAGAILSLGAAGCGKGPASEVNKKEVETEVGVNSNGGQTPSPNNENSDSATQINYQQSFVEAAITEVLEGHHLPLDVTIAGKKTGLLRAGIEDSWSNIQLTDAAGSPVSYVLHVETSEGPFEIKLQPAIAPNHVRNILALARAGFFDGLQFERNVHQESEIEGQQSRLDLLIAGCPNGNGEEGYGHLGYFMRSEFQPDLKHAEGTVGFWHEEDPDSAGCRFYITLGPAPALDGKFTIIGKVSDGLDVVKKIAAQPTVNADPASPDSEKPQRPVAIKKVAIAPELMEK